MILVVGQPNGVFYHRLQVPYEDLLMRGFAVKFGTIADLDQLKGHITHLVVNRGLATKDHNKFKALLRRYDIKFIVDLDDWWNLPTDHANKSISKGTQILNSLKIADEIHTTNEYLAEKIQKINPYVPIYILPNGIDPRREQWKTDKTTDELSIGYLGALHHDYDLSGTRLTCRPTTPIQSNTTNRRLVHGRHSTKRTTRTTGNCTGRWTYQ